MEGRKITSPVDEAQAPGKAAGETAGGLAELALTFLRLGATAFGGPAVHVALMEDEFVGRRRWLTREEFLDLLGATNLIPGPNSTEMAIHVGLRRGGFPGLVVAGACFIMPAALVVGLLAWGYVRYGGRPEASGLLYGIKPVVIAVLVQALWGLGRTALKTRLLTILGASAAAVNLAGAGEAAILLGCGLFVVLWTRIGAASGSASASAIFPWAVLPAPHLAASATPFGLGPLFLCFLKVGSLLFGSGYVLVAFLRADLVERLGWLTETQLLDAVAVGQMTPGPVLTTATFVGYLLAGVPGAAVATAGVFLPAFVLVALSGPIIPRIRRSPAAGAFLDGVNVASFALMAVAAGGLGLAAIVDFATAVVAVVSFVLLLHARINSGWLILGGGLIGLLVSAAG